MTSVDQLWYRTTQATQEAEQTYHRLADRYDPDLEFERSRSVSRRRFQTLLERVTKTGTPYGAHTIVYRADGAVLLVRHEGVDLWVLPGGEIRPSESIREAAERELAEESGIEATYTGLAMLTRYRLRCGEYDALGVLPIFKAVADTTDPIITDPDGEISAARWFREIPEDTRDRTELLSWKEQVFE